MKYLSGPRKLLLGLLLTLFFAGCSNFVENNTPLSVLAEEGELVIFDLDENDAIQLELTEVFVSDLVQQREIPVTVTFPNIVPVAFEATINQSFGITPHIWEYGRYYGPIFFEGQGIQEGDFIGELFFEVPTSLALERDALFLEIEEFERGFAREQNRRLAEINDLQREAANASYDTMEIAYLRLRQRQLEHTVFLNTQNDRREGFQDRLYRLEAPIQGERLYAPFSGMIYFVNWGVTAQHTNLFRERIFWQGGARNVVTILDTSDVRFTVYTPAYVMRFGDRLIVYLMGGEVYFNMHVVTDPLTQQVMRTGLFDFELAPVCMDEFFSTLEYHDMAVHDLRHGFWRAQPVLHLAFGATVVHQNAIAQEGPRDYVLLYENGSLSKRYVLLGQSLGTYVQILTGLEPGQKVVLR